MSMGFDSNLVSTLALILNLVQTTAILPTFAQMVQHQPLICCVINGYVFKIGKSLTLGSSLER
jgi:hypothetical protein